MKRLGRRLAITLQVGFVACASQRAPIYCAALAGAGPASDALDPTARGSAVLRIETATSLRYVIRTEGLGTVVATHIHRGGAGTNGPMAHELNPGFTSEASSGVAQRVPADVIADIERNPSQYYVKLHSLKYPGGAIRGQLAKCRSKELK